MTTAATKIETPNGVKFATEQFHGRVIDLYVDGAGTFRALFEGEEYASRDVSELHQYLLKATLTSKKRLALPAHKIDRDGHVRPIVLTGLHARNNTILIRFEDGKKEADTVGGWSDSHQVLNRLTPAEVSERKALRLAYEAAERALDKFDHEHSFKNLKLTVQRAMGEKV